MEAIYEVNWNIFKTKFNGREQKSFEDLCYLLFCSEFNDEKGVFRYKNQTGSETEPIACDGDVIAWQAKFLETKISTKKKDLLQAIEATKRKNRPASKILFYLNREFSESSRKDKKDPAYKTEIEDYAESLGVKVEWRVPSHFERQLALEKNRTLAQHFFSLGKSIVDFITELQNHTKSILAPIHSRINFNGKEIKIDRSADLENLRNALTGGSLAILSGVGGTGKTAVIKDLFDTLSGSVPFFVLRASEFNTSNVNDIFAHYGDFGFADFIHEHESINEKYVIIDSAEKLSDIESLAVLHEILSRLLESHWNIVFTTRHSFLDDLKWQLVEFYDRHSFAVINIEDITEEKLHLLATAYSFNLPSNDRLLELLRNPFHLTEYLQNYNSAEKSKTYLDFRQLIWKQKVQNSSYRKNNIHLEREKCFLEIAKMRANSASFYVKAANLNRQGLTALEEDEVIKYDTDNDGYFITHDTYEEWALDKIIEREFNKSADAKQFFVLLGSSLPVRRAFRSWLSEQILTNLDEVKSLIEESLVSNGIETFWKDEVLVSVLLSDYCEAFFTTFEKQLLEDNQRLLIRAVFLLRIACKEIDESMLRMLAVQYAERAALKSVFTVPKGRGWQVTVDFIHRHKEEFGLRHMNVIAPLLHDWNSKNKQGATTLKASQIALYYYEQVFALGGGYSRDESRGQIVNIILQGAQEIKPELMTILDKVLAEGKTGHRDKYHSIIKAVLTSIIDGIEVVKILPEYVLRLADLYWFRVPKKDFRHMRLDVQEDLCITNDYDFKYFPASALQTPIYQLLRTSFTITLDFILSFTNKVVECFAESELGSDVEEVTVIFDNGDAVRQYICNRLWNTYRGTQVSTELLESLHMALEKWLLEQAKISSQEVLESVCEYLLRNSKSASISAVVASVVMDQPYKLFNIARILFRTKEFFLYDSGRLALEQTHKVQLLVLKESFPNRWNYEHQIYEDERIKACDDGHRKLSLEHIAFQYQFVKAQDNADFEKQREAVQGILDEHYDALPLEPEQSAADRTWRLFLARMDARKMKVKAEPEKDGDRILLTFDPEIDPKLRKYSQDSLDKISEAQKYIPLKLWSTYRFKREEENYKQYQQYEENPQLAVSEARAIMNALGKGGEEFSLLNRSTPAYVCAVLVRDFFETMGDEEEEFCRQVIIGFASIPLGPETYSYQVTDGTEPAIMTLPRLMKCFPEARDEIKLLLFELLLNSWSPISNFATWAVVSDLWEVDFKSAQSIFLGYLILKPKYMELIEETRQENFKKGVYDFSKEDLLKKFRKRYTKVLKKIDSNTITYEEVGDLTRLHLMVLVAAFELLPLRTDDVIHNKFVRSIFPIFAKKLLREDREERIDHSLKQRFWDKYAYFVLTSNKKNIVDYIKPFVDNCTSSENMADFFRAFISAEDRLNQYDEFWMVWDLFYGPVVEICKARYFRSKEIIHNYLLAWAWWKESAKEWHSLKEREKLFLGKVALEIGHYPAVLYSLSKLLNDIGSKFIDDGIFWISGILRRNPNYASEKLDTNTVYYIENVIRKYVITDRQRIKRTSKIKDAVIVILNFLVETGSITGYLLREDIL